MNIKKNCIHHLIVAWKFRGFCEKFLPKLWRENFLIWNHFYVHYRFQVMINDTQTVNVNSFFMAIILDELNSSLYHHLFTADNAILVECLILFLTTISWVNWRLKNGLFLGEKKEKKKKDRKLIFQPKKLPNLWPEESI